MPWAVICHTPGCGWRTHLAERSLAEGWQEFHQKTHPGHALTLEQSSTPPDAQDDPSHALTLEHLIPPAEAEDGPGLEPESIDLLPFPEPAGGPPTGRTILIVEDSAYLRRQLVQRVVALGERPLEAAAALDGLQLAAQQRPALILLDLGLPDLDGLAACQLFRSDPATAAIPLIAMGTDSPPGPAEVRAFCRHYLPKPVHLPAYNFPPADYTVISTTEPNACQQLTKDACQQEAHFIASAQFSVSDMNAGSEATTTP